MDKETMKIFFGYIFAYLAVSMFANAVEFCVQAPNCTLEQLAEEKI